MTRAPYDARRRPDPRGMDSLSPREREILRAYVRIGHYAGMAEELGIRRQTVANHVTHILHKLDLNALGQAAVLWDRAERLTWPEVDRRVAERRSGERRA